mgnify:CR=1 FL=1|jgi:phage baseplate assembly protein W|tara:strand:- start:12300 stop:12707 length:408 start_codon:yes stop_codon:yes gene_type:complete
MSSIANDLNPDTFVGLSFPLGRDTSGTWFKRHKTLLEQARDNLKNLLLTNVGERPAQPEFGSRLLSVVFEFKDDSLIEEVINEAVDRWLPYINIKAINTTVEPRNPNQLNVEIKFGVTTDPEATEQITLDFAQGE